MIRATTTALAATGLLMAATPSQAAVVFSQDFSDGGNVADYQAGSAATITGDKFTTIGTVGAATGSIVGNAFSFQLDSSATDDAGGFFIQDVAGAPAPYLMTAQVRLAIDLGDTVSGSTNWVGRITIGNDGSNGPALKSSSSNQFAAVGIHYDIANNGYHFHQGGIDSAIYSNGDFATVTIFANNTDNSGTPQNVNYVAPDGSSRTLNADSYTVYVDQALLVENRAAERDWQNLLDFRVVGNEPSTNSNSTYTIDSVTVTNDLVIPEPGSLALLGLGALMIVGRRR